MKKECDDFRKHPDFGNFVREECASVLLSPASSAGSSFDHEERGSGRDAGYLSDHYRGTEDEDMELAVPKGLWTAGKMKSRIIIIQSLLGGAMGLLKPCTRQLGSISRY